MTIFDNVYPLGLGTNRFPIKSAADEEGIIQSAQIVVNALKAGVNFIDVTHTYSRGMAQEVLRRAFKEAGEFTGVTIKTRLDIDKRADDVRKRLDDSLSNMGISRARYLFFWSVFSYKEFEALMKPGGAYEGAVRLKEGGIVDHICFSTHAPVEDIIKILESEAFEAVTISFSLLNSLRYTDVLQTARRLNIGIAAMNPLGGGVIPNNNDYFAFARNSEDKTTNDAAMRYVLAHKDIQVALSGVSSLEELDQNLKAVNIVTSETHEHRIERVNSCIKKLDNFCTGCNYCSGCPAGIPISAIMQCRNSLTFDPSDTSYAFASETVRQNIYVVGKLEQEYSVLFETTDNPCICCGECERKCTQHLKIIDAVADTYKRAESSNHSRQARIRRLNDLIVNSPENTVGLYPGGIMTHSILRFYSENVGEPQFKVALFDSNPTAWGTGEGLHTIYPPDDIAVIKPSVVIVTSYKFKNEIYDAIKHYEVDGIRIVKLSGNKELPWLL